MDSASTPQGRLPEVPTRVTGLVLRELTPEDADAYYALLDRNRLDLSRWVTSGRSARPPRPGCASTSGRIRGPTCAT
ncbi:hypothetical protein ACFVFN_31985, partial [Streptomyces pharetrae]